MGCEYLCYLNSIYQKIIDGALVILIIKYFESTF